jgi:hypothetical protein
MAKSTKTTKSVEAKQTAPKKGPASKVSSTTKKSAPVKRAATKKSSAKVDPGTQLEKVCKEAVAKLQKMENVKYQEVRENLEWCIGSYNYDRNPSGIIEFGRKAVDIFKEARDENPRKVSKKLVADLDKALARF